MQEEVKKRNPYPLKIEGQGSWIGKAYFLIFQMDNLYRKVKYNILRKITKLSCVIGCTTEKVCIVLGGATLHKDMTNMLAVLCGNTNSLNNRCD